jgi:uncharacterized membrane protein
MTQPIENYVSQSFLPLMRKQAWKIWSVSLLVVLGWNLLILLAPIAQANGFENISAPLYKFFGYICHQIDARSFHFYEHQFAVCSRCFGVYFGLFLGFAVYPLFRKIEEIEPFPRVWLFLAMIPIGIDWSLTAFGIWENTHLSRFVTGTILGAACGIFIVPALVEIFWNVTGKKLIAKIVR